MNYKEGDTVYVTNLQGIHSNKKYKGVIRGVSNDYGSVVFYIVHMIDFIDDNYEYSSRVIVSSCIEPAKFEYQYLFFRNL